MNQQAVLAQALGTVGAQLEQQLDQEIHRLDHLNDAEMAQIRHKRVADIKRRQEKSKEWLARGHGEYTEIFTEAEFFKTMKVRVRELPRGRA